MITAPRCRHIKTNGLTCKSPALQGGSRCFFHERQRVRHSRFRAFADAPGLTKPGEHMPLIPVDDHDSIQLALSMVINGLAIGHLGPMRARTLLYGLQIAAGNAKNLNTEPVDRNGLPLTTHTDPFGEELAQPGGAVDITHPSIRQQREVEEWIANSGDDQDDDEDDDEDDEEELEDDDDYEDNDDEEEEYDEEDDLKVFTEVDQFMRRHP